MKYTITIFLAIILASCKFADTHYESNKLGINKVVKDTLITYDIPEISTEGAEARVSFTNAKIESSIIHIYSTTWQTVITYKFRQDKIEVSETKYLYKTELENVKSSEDMQQDYSINYSIDLEGNVIEKDILNRMDIFQEFKKIVPFEL